MSRNRLILIAVALLAALVAAYLASGLQPQAPQVIEALVQKADTVEVMTAGRDVPFAGLIDDQAIAWTEWPRTAVTAEMIQRDDTERTEKIKNGRVRVTVYKGEPLDLRKVVPAGDVSFMSAILPKGHRAVPVAISPQTASGGFILPGDRVDVMLKRPNGALATVVQNVRVLAIDQVFRQDPSKGESVIQGALATLDLTMEQANALAVLGSKSTFNIALRSLADNEGVTPEADIPELMPEFKRAAMGGVTVVRAGATSNLTSN